MNPKATREAPQKTLPSRARCGFCRDYYAVDFWVTNEVWNLTMNENNRHTPACLTCFTRMADERLVRWEVGMEVTPVSLITNLERTKNPHLIQAREE